MNSQNTSQLSLQVSHYETPDDVLASVVFARFLAGEMRWARSLRLYRVRREATLLPAGVIDPRVAIFNDRSCALAEGDGWMVRVTKWHDRSADITVLAIDEATGQTIYDDAIRDAVEPEPEPDANVVHIGFWHQGAHNARRRVKSLVVEPWPVIRRNYPGKVAKAFDALMAISPDTVSGRMLLLHGPPGTGKTTALRALAHAWEKWCRLDYVLDPERLLSDSGYLMTTTIGDDDDEHSRWRLLLLEDCDELIRSDAKRGSGQSLARLLNLTDGLLGQGLDVIVGITTNEPLTSLHPAIVRPGRCIAHIEVGKFNRVEAIDWLGRPASINADGATLAELFALRGEITTVENTSEAQVVGLYL